MWQNRYTQGLIEKIDILSSDSTMQRIAMHHIYEYEKGIRAMVLCTLSPEDCTVVCNKLKARAIDFYCKRTPGGGNVNLFFGKKSCIELVQIFLLNKDLHELNDEEDFIIGTLLGYDIAGQCDRYLLRHSHENEHETVA